MIQDIPKVSIPIPACEMYQEWNCLKDLVEEDSVKPKLFVVTWIGV